MAAAIAILEASGLLLFVSLIGLGVTLNFPRLTLLVPQWIAAPVIGLGVLQVAGWYWLDISNLGIRPFVFVLLVAAVGAIVVGTVRRSRSGGDRSGGPVGALVGPVTVAVLSMAIGTVLMSGYLDGPRPSSISYGNNDIVSYVQVSKHLLGEGFSSSGSIVGANLGKTASIDASGVRVVLSSIGVLTGQDMSEVTVAAMLALFVVGALALYWVVTLVTDTGLTAGAILVGAAIGASGVMYLLGQYFLSQLASMAGITAFLGVLLVAGRAEQQWVGRFALAIVGAAALAPVLITYPHMALLGGAVSGVVAVGSLGRRRLVSRSLEITLVAALAVIGALLSIAPHVAPLIERARYLIGVTGGWEITLTTPFRAIGFGRFGGSPYLTPTGVEWWGQFAAIVLVVSIATLLRWRRSAQAPLFPLVVAFLVFAGYRYAAMQKGAGGYGSWKWMTFFQPLLIVAVGISVLEIVYLGIRQLRDAKQAELGLALPMLIWCVASLYFSSALFRSAPVRIPQGIPALTKVAESNVRSVNIDLAPYWTTMWATYFLSDLTVHVSSPSYYSASMDLESWAVRLLADVKGASVPITDGNPYGLVCGDSICTPETVSFGG